jgi:hypothetical protein
MQNLIDLITNNLAFFIGVFVFILFVVGFVLAMSTETGRNAMGKAAVRFAIAALEAAEKWLGLEIAPQPDTRTAKRVPVRDELTRWLADYSRAER